jgi:hypothetical protein
MPRVRRRSTAAPPPAVAKKRYEYNEAPPVQDDAKTKTAKATAQKPAKK